MKGGHSRILWMFTASCLYGILTATVPFFEAVLPRRDFHGIFKTVQGSADIEFFVFKPAGELWEFIVRNEPAVLVCICNFKLLHGFFFRNSAQSGLDIFVLCWIINRKINLLLHFIWKTGK